jgi:hypothetical protein
VFAERGACLFKKCSRNYGCFGHGGNDEGWTCRWQRVGKSQSIWRRPGHAFHYRYDTAAELKLLNALHALVRVRLNLLTAATAEPKPLNSPN